LVSLPSRNQKLARLLKPVHLMDRHQVPMFQE
jgi:hypothetical protein